jgi:hypothetical protein
MSATMLVIARTDALFVSPVSADSFPASAELDTVVRAMVRRHGGSRGCAAEVAAHFGDHPEDAVRRMLWARQVVAAAFPGSVR